jgi:hypothetical protein
MTTWILVLSILRYNAVSMEQVPTFSSEKACMNAASAWLQEMKKKGADTVFTLSALCVPNN